MRTTPGDKLGAIGELARLWRIDPTREQLTDTCPLSGADISCLRLAKITAAELRRYNTPLILALQDGVDAPRYVVLMQLQAARARIRSGGRDWNVPWSALLRQWQGDALLLVPAPVAQLPLQPGATDSLIAWFDTRLYRYFHRDQRRWQREVYDRSDQLVDSASKSAWLVGHYLALREQPPSDVYDAPLLAEVKRFQREQGLPDNGVIDVATLVALSRVSTPDFPALSGADKRGG